MANRIKVIIVDDVATREQISSFLATDREIIILGQASLSEEVIQQATKLQPDIILMSSSLADTDGFSVTKRLKNEVPYSNVILMSYQNSSDDFRQAMIAGAKDYLVKPFSMGDLLQSIKRTYANSDNQRASCVEQEQGKIISLFSTKGGVGKTILATNLALAISSKYKIKVAILDFDLQFGDVSVCLNVFPKASIADVVTDIEQLDEAILARYMVPYNDFLHVLPAPFQPEMAEKVAAQHLIVILNLLKKMYQYIIIDTAPAFDDKTLTAMDYSDFIFVVSLPDLTTTRNVKLSLRTLETLGYSQEKIKLVMNRFNSMGALKINEIEDSLKQNVGISLPNDSTVVLTSVNNGVPFVITHPDSQISRAIFNLAKSIVTGELMSQNNKAFKEINRADGGVLSKLKKIFG